MGGTRGGTNALLFSILFSFILSLFIVLPVISPSVLTLFWSVPSLFEWARAQQQFVATSCKTKVRFTRLGRQCPMNVMWNSQKSMTQDKYLNPWLNCQLLPEVFVAVTCAWREIDSLLQCNRCLFDGKAALGPSLYWLCGCPELLPGSSVTAWW